MINLFQDVMANVSQKIVNFMGRGISQGHGNKILRPLTSFMTNWTQKKFKNY